MDPVAPQGTTEPDPRDRTKGPIRIRAWRESTTSERLLVLAALVVAVAPVLWGAWSAARSGYIPTGDDAVIAVRSADVFGTNSPTLGMPSGTGAWTGTDAYHPGPMIFWAYAPFVRLLGPANGLMAGVAAIGTAAIAGVAVAALRRGGASMATLALLATTVCYWTTGGTTVLFLPLNPFVALLPYWCFLFLSWGVAARDRILVPWWILTGSFVVQADLAYLPGVGLVVVAVIGSLLVSERNERAVHHLSPRPRPDPLRVTVALHLALIATLMLSLLQHSTSTVILGAGLSVSVALFLALGPRRPIPSWSRWSIAAVTACWTVPMAQALATGVENLRALAGVAELDHPTQGLQGATRALRLLIAGPVRSTGTLEVDEFTAAWRILDVLLLLVLVLGVGVGVAHRLGGRRRGTPPSPPIGLTVVGTAAAAASLLAAAEVPLADGFKHYYYFSVTATAAFVWFALIVKLGPRLRSPRAGSSPGLLALLVAFAAIITATRLSSPSAQPVTVSDFDGWHRDALPELAAEIITNVDPSLTYELVASGGPNMRVLENGLWGQLIDRDFTLRTPVLANYYGTERNAAFSDPAPDGVLWLLPAGLAHPPAGAAPVASFRPDGFDPGALDQLAEDISTHVRDTGALRLTPAAEFNMGFVLYGRVDDICPTERPVASGCDTGKGYFEDPERLLDAPAAVLLDAYRSGYVASPALTPELEAALQDLRHRPVTVWLGPAAAGAR